jgi:dipeptidase
MGQINEYQLAITETTFGGREELDGAGEGIDYVSLMTLGLQRAKTAREAIKVMTELVNKYGYASSGESFSIADPNEVWMMEMIGKGKGREGAVWVAVRIPDDCIAAHANHSRIHKFDLKDKDNVMYAKDVITFARQKGYFTGKDADFSFSATYAPADFGAIRYCDTRVWSFYNKWVEGMDQYLDYATGKAIGKHEPMPLYFKPKCKLSLADVMESNRDHYEGTPFDVTKDAGAGAYCMPYRPSPLTWKHEGKTYFNERPISTQQTAFTVVAQVRDYLPNAIGGVLWYANDDPNMAAYTPVYCANNAVPECYNVAEANDVTFSIKSAFWVCNWVANMTYPRYSQMFPSLKAVRDRLETTYFDRAKQIEGAAGKLFEHNPADAVKYLTAYSQQCSEEMMSAWLKLAEYQIVKFNDMVVKPEKAGKFELTPDGIAVPPLRPGFDESQKATIVRETGDKYLLPTEQIKK